jgi:RNA polymerase-interacting CarD/CdnL/TRCF family regulator
MPGTQRSYYVLSFTFSKVLRLVPARSMATAFARTVSEPAF